MQRQRETEEELANSKAHREKVQKQKEREEQERVEQVTIYTTKPFICAWKLCSTHTIN